MGNERQDSSKFRSYGEWASDVAGLQVGASTLQENRRVLETEGFNLVFNTVEGIKSFKSRPVINFETEGCPQDLLLMTGGSDENIKVAIRRGTGGYTNGKRIEIQLTNRIWGKVIFLFQKTPARDFFRFTYPSHFKVEFVDNEDTDREAWFDQWGRFQTLELFSFANWIAQFYKEQAERVSADVIDLQSRRRGEEGHTLTHQEP